jgi:hypothetical protein
LPSKDCQARIAKQGIAIEKCWAWGDGEPSRTIAICYGQRKAMNKLQANTVETLSICTYEVLSNAYLCLGN